MYYINRYILVIQTKQYAVYGLAKLDVDIPSVYECIRIMEDNIYNNIPLRPYIDYFVYYIEKTQIHFVA